MKRWTNHGTPQKHARRTGSSLVQMLVVITLTGIISVVVITTLASLMRTEGRAATTWINHHSLLRLSEDFRRDAHQATAAEISSRDGVSVLTLRFAESAARSVVYEAVSNEVRRREADSERMVRVESYRLPDWNVTFQPSPRMADKPQTLAAKSVVTLLCERPYRVRATPHAPEPRRTDPVLAVLGRDQRWSRPAESSAAEKKLPE